MGDRRRPLRRQGGRYGSTRAAPPPGAGAVAPPRRGRPAPVSLDISLPDSDGLEVRRRTRPQQPEPPVFSLPPRDSVGARVAGLTAGGDDYVTKPFSLEEVVA